MSIDWPQHTIRELIALGETSGEARATLGTPEEARLFRFAIYTFRKEHNVGFDLRITLEENVVVLRRRPQPVIVIAGTEAPCVAEGE